MAAKQADEKAEKEKADNEAQTSAESLAAKAAAEKQLSAESLAYPKGSLDPRIFPVIQDFSNGLPSV